jgi:hypothetical protein
MNPLAYKPPQASTLRRAAAVAVVTLIAVITGARAYSWHSQREGTNAPVLEPRSPPAGNPEHAAVENPEHAAVENPEHAAVENVPLPRPQAAHAPATPLPPASTGSVEQPGKGIDRAAASAALKKALDSRIQRLELELAASSSTSDAAEATRLRIFIGRLRNQATAISADAEQGPGAPQTSEL